MPAIPENCQISEEGNNIVIKIDKTKVLGPSASGKTILIGSTKGAVQYKDGIMVNVNIYKKNT